MLVFAASYTADPEEPPVEVDDALEELPQAAAVKPTAVASAAIARVRFLCILISEPILSSWSWCSSLP
jgi:hypothetical protein